MIIAIDGPAGSGKSTIARILSQKLNLEYIDSGAIYRTLTLHGMNQYENTCSGNEQKIADYFTENPDDFDLTYEDHTQIMWLKGKNVSKEIRTQEVTKQIRYIANHATCREIVNSKMRALASKYSFVVDGRDIGTEVFPDTPHKFYLDATPEIRATRRAKELELPLEGEEFEKMLADIIDRDQSDMNRELAPLKQADDAILVETSNMSIEEVVAAIEQQIRTN